MDILEQPNFNKLYNPPQSSHKGQNGRLLVIGGSKLFHASIFFSADVASKIVDLVHFSSPANENNDLVRQKIKSGFWNGIVIDWSDIESYIAEDDCILIGPGMPRKAGKKLGDIDTSEVTDHLLKTYPNKRWVVDGGALQEVNPKLLNGNMIITPHHKEWEILIRKENRDRTNDKEDLLFYSKSHGNLTILLKGQVDIVCQGDEIIQVKGGNAGMTKGGTGDVLAGLVAALFCKNNAWLAATTASFVNKKAGDRLYQTVGPNFNASELIEAVPKTIPSVNSPAYSHNHKNSV